LKQQSHKPTEFLNLHHRCQKSNRGIRPLFMAVLVAMFVVSILLIAIAAALLRLVATPAVEARQNGSG
jgi:uncharacterized membrane protein